MLLCFASGLGPNRDESDLCIVPDKPDLLSVPVRMRDFQETIAGFHRIGPEEGVSITFDQSDGGMVIAALPPGSIYLTPNLSQSPGFKVRKVKIFDTEGRYKTLYEREGKGWEEWNANRERQ
jgi:hypothetical protein